MTTENNALTLYAVSTMVDEFRNQHVPEFTSATADIAGQIAALDTKRNDLTYDMIAKLVEMALTFNVKAQTGPYREFLAHRQISAARDGNNPYLPFIKAIFAEKVGDSWEFPKTQRGREKHANHVRLLVDRKQRGLVEGTVQDFIRSFDEKLKGIEEQDRKENPSAAQAKRVDDTRDRGRRTAPQATSQNAFGHKDGAVVKLMGRIRDGQLEVLVVDKANDNEAESLWYRLGKAAAK